MSIASYDQAARITELTDRIAELESNRDHLQRGFNAALETVQVHEARIAELEAAIAALKNARLDWAMVCECACDACEVLSSRIARLPQSDRDCGHGQVVQNGCPCCEKKIGYPLGDDSQSDRGAES